MLIVKLRWSGLSFKEIGLMTNVNQMTCNSAYRSFYTNGGTAVKAISKGRPALPVPKDVSEHLIHNLYESRFLSLRERMREIKTKFDFTIPLKYVNGI